jgi:hypothetical protein
LVSSNSLAEHFALLVRKDGFRTFRVGRWENCSATGPNRTYLWSGMIDPDGAAGGPAYDGGSESGLSYTTYAQEPQAAGVTWKVYQAYDNYGDNALEYFVPEPVLVEPALPGGGADRRVVR